MTRARCLKNCAYHYFKDVQKVSSRRACFTKVQKLNSNQNSYQTSVTYSNLSPTTLRYLKKEIFATLFIRKYTYSFTCLHHRINHILLLFSIGVLCVSYSLQQYACELVVVFKYVSVKQKTNTKSEKQCTMQALHCYCCLTLFIFPSYVIC